MRFYPTQRTSTHHHASTLDTRASSPAGTQLHLRCQIPNEQSHAHLHEEASVRVRCFATSGIDGKEWLG